MSPPIEPDTFGVLDATEEMDSPVSVAPLRGCHTAESLTDKADRSAGAHSCAAVHDRINRTYELPFLEAVTKACGKTPAAAAPVPVAALPPRNTLPAPCASGHAGDHCAAISSMPIPEPVWATFSPIAAR